MKPFAQSPFGLGSPASAIAVSAAAAAANVSAAAAAAAGGGNGGGGSGSENHGSPSSVAAAAVDAKGGIAQCGSPSMAALAGQVAYRFSVFISKSIYNDFSHSQTSAAPSWQGRAIATHKLRMLEFSGFVEQQRDAECFNKHLFVHIGGPVSYADPVLEVRSKVFINLV